jgi:hypothetical protein
MTPFEYVSVLISIVLGLGITQIVSGLADIIHQWSRVKLYWPHLMWIVFVFFLHIQEWWVLYDLRTLSEWKLPTFLFIILYPINLFILARILFPSAGADSATDFKEFYFENFRKFFVWAVILIALSMADNLLLNGYSWVDQPVHIFLLIALPYFIYKNFRQEWLHKLVVILLTALLIASLLLVEWTLKI